MKIYTKAGDRGMTTLLGGELVSKDHPRLEAYGTLDELNSWIGLLESHMEDREIKDDMLRIQDRLMAASGILASEKPESITNLPEITPEDIRYLEQRIDTLQAELPGLSSFILPGGHPFVSYCHLARTTCRRAERYSLPFAKGSEKTGILLKYLNRLSDYLFVLARKIARDFNVKEIPWQP
jgi:cob(I)alamin adenosyltransferase